MKNVTLVYVRADAPCVFQTQEEPTLESALRELGESLAMEWTTDGAWENYMGLNVPDYGITVYFDPKAEGPANRCAEMLLRSRLVDMRVRGSAIVVGDGLQMDVPSRITVPEATVSLLKKRDEMLYGGAA